MRGFQIKYMRCMYDIHIGMLTVLNKLQNRRKPFYCIIPCNIQCTSCSITTSFLLRFLIFDFIVDVIMFNFAFGLIQPIVRKDDLCLMASLSATFLMWLSPTNKTERFFGVFCLFLCAHKALCTFGMLVVDLSDDS